MQTLTIKADESVLNEIIAFLKGKDAKFDIIDDDIKNGLLKDINDCKKGNLKTSLLASKWKYLNENNLQ